MDKTRFLAVKNKARCIKEVDGCDMDRLLCE